MNGSSTNRPVAAFFDIDGTLVPPPSLERRFVGFLLWRCDLSAINGLRWIVEAIRLAPRGVSAMRHANKMYLRGLRASLDGDGGLRFVLPTFFPLAIERVARHAAAGHDIVLVSGTLAPLAKLVGRALEAQMNRLGCQAPVRVCATRLEESRGVWSGRVLGGPIVGGTKAQAALRLARELGYDLAYSYAYGNSSRDRWLLAAVGNPAVVNPTSRLMRIARAAGWPILHWSGSSKGTAAPHREIGFTEIPVSRRASRTT